MSAAYGELETLFEPTIGPHGHPSTSLESWTGTRNYLVLVELHNVKTTLRSVSCLREAADKSPPLRTGCCSIVTALGPQRTSLEMLCRYIGFLKMLKLMYL